MRIDLKEIDPLIEKVKEIALSERNLRLKKELPRVAVMVGIGRSFLSRINGYDMVEFYRDPSVRVWGYLKNKLYLFENFPDDTVVDPSIGYDYGAAGTLESEMLGIPSVFVKEKDPFVAVQPNIIEYGDLKKLQIPDFFSTGPMPLIHEQYDEVCKIVDRRLDVSFPGWVRGPWSLACFLRGFTQLYMDIIDEPGFVADLLDFTVEARMSWEKQRSEFLDLSYKEPENMFTNCYDDYRRVHVSDQYSDEVDGALVSPAVYEELLYPSEQKLANFYGGVRYYHSCGNLTPLLPKLTTLTGLNILHISSWTDLAKARDLTGDEVTLQIALHPEDDVINATEEQIRAKTREILETVGSRKTWICADAVYGGDIDGVKKWLQITRDEVEKSGVNS